MKELLLGFVLVPFLGKLVATFSPAACRRNIGQSFGRELKQ